MLGTAQILWLPYVSPKLIGIIGICSAVLFTASIKTKWAKPLAVITLGLCYALLHCQIQLNNQTKSPVIQSLEIQVESLPRISAHKISFVGSEVNGSKKYLFNWYKENNTDPIIKAGSIYAINARIKPPHGLANGVGFDLEKWLFRQNISGTATIKSIKELPKTNHSMRTSLNLWRADLSKKINLYFENPQVNALVHALSIGDKSHFEQQDTLLFQKTGTAHLIAISGLHIGMVALLGWLLGGWIYWLFPSQRINRQLIQIILGIAFAGFYAGLANLAISTQRALIMLVVFGTFKLLRRNGFAWDVWSLSLLIVLLLDPLNVLDPGFWLSFTAVAVLIINFNGVNNNQNRFLDFIKTQGIILIGMLPLSLAIFSRVNLFAPLINLLLIPLMTFLLIPLILLLLVFGSLFSFFPVPLVEFINYLSTGFLTFLNWFDQFSQLTFNTVLSHWWQFALIFIGSLVLILPAAIPGRLFGLLFILLGLFKPIQQPQLNHFEAQFIDVGQGLSVLIKTNQHNLLYDVGAAYDSGFNMADAAIIPLLKQNNIKHIDAMVISHQDNDHAGAEPVFSSKISVNKKYGTEPSHTACQTGHHWQWDGVYFEFLSPYNLIPYLQNNSSCVLKITGESSSLLLTGDIESPVEYRLTQYHSESIASDVLLMPHHGSKTSSTTEFITAVNPSWSINSSGKYNPFNHPAAEVIQRYEKLGIPILDTQDEGLINLSTYPELTITSYRQQNPRIWRTKKPE